LEVEDEDEKDSPFLQLDERPKAHEMVTADIVETVEPQFERSQTPLEKTHKLIKKRKKRVVESPTPASLHEIIESAPEEAIYSSSYSLRSLKKENHISESRLYRYLHEGKITAEEFEDIMFNNGKKK
jgi:hypothetical protein